MSRPRRRSRLLQRPRITEQSCSEPGTCASTSFASTSFAAEAQEAACRTKRRPSRCCRTEHLHTNAFLQDQVAARSPLNPAEFCGDLSSGAQPLATHPPDPAKARGALPRQCPGMLALRCTLSSEARCEAILMPDLSGVAPASDYTAVRQIEPCGTSDQLELQGAAAGRAPALESEGERGYEPCQTVSPSSRRSCLPPRCLLCPQGQHAAQAAPRAEVPLPPWAPACLWSKDQAPHVPSVPPCPIQEPALIHALLFDLLDPVPLLLN